MSGYDRALSGKQADRALQLSSSLGAICLDLQINRTDLS